LFQEFISPVFNAKVRLRTKSGRAISQTYIQQLRWAAVKAWIAAHEAVVTVPLQNADGARDAAISLLKQVMQEAMDGDARVDGAEPWQQAPTISVEFLPQPLPAAITASVPATASVAVLTPGVSRIAGRMTGSAVVAQCEAAKAQPRDEVFYSTADTAVIDHIYGNDLAGTAVRMTWRSSANADTEAQQLTSAVQFMDIAGVQQVSQIRQHHLDPFSNLIGKKMRAIYWSSDKEKDLTGRALMEQAKASIKPCGMTPARA
jgi:hypothetical protein